MVFMIEVYVLLNMSLNVISCDVIVTMSFDIQSFECH